MTAWIDVLARYRECGEPCVVVSVVSTRGSVPREAGTRMIVARDALHGTIGGGHLEEQATSIARDVIASGAEDSERLRRFPLGASLGQCCGGLVNLLFEPVTAEAPWIEVLRTLDAQRIACVIVSSTRGPADTRKLVVTADRTYGSLGSADGSAVQIARGMLSQRTPAQLVNLAKDADGAPCYFDPVLPCDFEIVLFGAGHVGRALVHVLAGAPCHVTWVDERDDAFPGDVPANVTVVRTDLGEAEVDAAPPGSYFLVMTHSHPLDEALSERILKRGDFAYFGLIGSATKRRQFERRMERRGMPASRFASMTCPIGVDGIPGKEPAAIAIAVAAELLQVHARVASANASSTSVQPRRASAQ